MKLFQQCWWLLPPGFIATGVNAAELNINGVSDYAASDQVTRSPILRRLPHRLGLQALAGLVETYGRVAGYPNGTFRGNCAMTRRKRLPC